ncbi:hypothetical protein BGX23_011742 [Mortierella sp. AD031]|nr:hypothetical protein BGX23_011742 [Mortierella sp. AD031]KAG0214860.1 hypothetical protein BGX33_001756 [Mortierella sp. NVP41]
MNQPKPAQKHFSPSPTSPTRTTLNRANSEFYTAPTFDQSKRKNSTMLPSPPAITQLDLDAKSILQDPFYHHPDDDLPNHHSYSRFSIRTGSNPTSPIMTPVQPKVAITMASPPPSRSSFLPSFRSMEIDAHKPFRIDPADVPPRPTSASANLSENALRGLKRLSNEALASSNTNNNSNNNNTNNNSNNNNKNSSSNNNNNNNINQGGSPVPTGTGNSHPDNTQDEEHKRLLFKRIDELNTRTSALEASLNESIEQKQYAEQEQIRTRKAFDKLAKEKHELQAKLDARERDYETMSKNYLEHVRLIRATDDDHSTIIERLTQLKAIIEQMIRKAQGSRSINLNRAAAIEYITSYGLLENFPIAEKNLEPFHINLFMESVVMRALLRFFEEPLCVVFEYNKGFKQIYDWMSNRNQAQAVRWRQQLCLMLTQDPETKARQEKEVAVTADALNELISRVYNNTNEAAKIRDICNRAFDLSVAMTGIDSVIKPVVTPLNTPFNEEYMRPSLKSNPEGKVALVIFPAFKDKEENFNLGPKVWCH